MTFDQLLAFLLGINIWSLVKVLFLVALLIYIAFAIIVVRQVNLMRETLNGVLDWPLRIIAWIHLGMAVGVFLLALVIL